MYSPFTTSFAICALAAQVFAGVFVTNPVAGSTAQGGQSMTIQWKDDNSPPSLTEIGPCEIGIYSGNMQQQTELQPINPSVDVSKTMSLTFNVNPAIGPNSDKYFVRFTSINLKDSGNPQFPYEAFSAKFSLSGMSGQFSPAVQSQINGITSASAAGPTAVPPSAPAPSNSTVAASKIITSANSAAKSTGTSSTSAPKTTATNAAITTRSNAGIFGALSIAALLGSLL